MNKNKHRTAIISSEEMSTNSYNTSEEEEEVLNQNFKNSIRRKKEKMNKFFLENPNLLNYFDFKNTHQNKENNANYDHKAKGNLKGKNDFWKIGSSMWNLNENAGGNKSKKIFLEDIEKTKQKKVVSEVEANKQKMLNILKNDVKEHSDLKNNTSIKALEQLFKKINIFKTKVLEMDKSPFIDTILEEEIDYQSDNDSKDSNQYKKHELKKGA